MVLQFEFVGNLTKSEKNEQRALSRRLLFPREEDFGIVPVEAHSFGRAVIAYGRSGGLETVQRSLLLQGPFEVPKRAFSPAAIGLAAVRFSKDLFKEDRGFRGGSHQLISQQRQRRLENVVR